MATRDEYMLKYGKSSRQKKNESRLEYGISQDHESHRDYMDHLKDIGDDLMDIEEAEKNYEDLRMRLEPTRGDYMDKYALEYAEKYSNTEPVKGMTTSLNQEWNRKQRQKKREEEDNAEKEKKATERNTSITAGKEKAEQGKETREKEPWLFRSSVPGGSKGSYAINEIRSGKLDMSMIDPEADRYKEMTDEEEDQYYYLLGLYGEKEAEDYLGEIDGVLRARRMEREKQKAADLAKEHPVIGTLGNISASMVSALGYLSDLKNRVTGKEYDPYSKGHYASAREAATREGLRESARENIWDSDVMDFMVDTGLSIGQSAARLPAGQAGAVLAGLGAATGGVEDAMERGASINQALGLGAAYGAAETGMERFSIGRLKAMKDAPVYRAGDIFKNLGKQMATEASEEMATEFANTVSDRAIMGESSRLEQAKKAYQEAGESPKNAYMDIARQIGLAGLGGAVSGGVMGGGAAALGTAQQNRLGKGDMDFREIADSIDTDPDTYKSKKVLQQAEKLQGLAQSYADSQSRGEKLTGLQRGGFMRDYFDLLREIDRTENSRTDHNRAGTGIFSDNATAPDMDLDGENGTENNVRGTAMEDQGEESGRNVPDPVPSAEPENIRRQSAGEWADQTAGGPGKQPVIREVAPVQPEYTRAEVAEHGNFGENGQRAFAGSYDGATSIGDYRKAFGRYYDAGRYNAEMETAEKAAIASILTPEQAAAAYKAGAQDRNLIARQKPEYVQGAPKTGMAADLSGMATGTQMQFAESVGKKTGLKIELVSRADGKSGAYVPEKGVIRLAVDSGNFLQTASHELTHFIRDYAPDHYEGYKQTVIQALMNADSVSYDGLVEQYERRYQEAGQNLSREEITEEIAADATGRFLNDEEFIGNLARDNRTIAEKIRDFLSDMVDAIKELISGKGITKAAEGLHEQLDYYEQARDMYAYALDEASGRRKGGAEVSKKNEGLERFQIEKPELVTEELIEKNYDAVRNMNSLVTIKGDEFQGTAREIRPQILKLYDSYGNKVHNEVVGDIHLTGQSVRDDLSHGFSRRKAAAFASVKAILEKGMVLRYSKNWKNRDYDAVVIGGKIEIEKGEDAGEYYEICVVRIGQNNRLYLHEVDIEKTDSVPFNYAKDYSPDISGYDYPSINSIFEKLREVNRSVEKSEGTRGGDLEPDTSESKEGSSGLADSVRLQLEDVDQEQYDSLAAENKELREANEELKRQLTLTKDFVPRTKDIEKTAGRLLRTYHSGYSQKSLENNLSKLYNYMKSTTGASMAEVDEAAQAIARSIVRNARLKDEVREEFRTVLDHIRGTRISLPQAYRSELESQGGYEAFRKKYFNKLRLSNDGIDVDTAYQEMTEKFPDQFPADIINPVDELLQIADVYDNLQPKMVNPYHANMEEMITIIAQEIKADVDNIQALPLTMADEMKAEVYRTQREYHRKTEAYKAKLKGEYESDMTEAEKIVARKEKELGIRIMSLKDQLRDLNKQEKAAENEEQKMLRESRQENWKQRKELGREQEKVIARMRLPGQSRTEVEKLREEKEEISRQLRELYDQNQTLKAQETEKETEPLRQIRKQKQELKKEKDTLEKEREYLKNQVNFDMLIGKMKYQRKRDAAESRKHREHIIRDINELGRWLDTPTDKKHVPESLRVPLAEFLSGMDYSSSRTNTEGKPTNRTVQWMKLKDQFAQIAKAGSTLEEGETVYMDVDPALEEKMMTLTDRVDSFGRLEDLELKDLRTLRDVVASIRHCIQDANQLLENKNYEKVADVSKQALRDLKDRPDKTGYVGMRGAADSLFKFDMLDAGTMFRQFGPAMESVYKAARSGLDKKIRNTKTAQDYMEKLLEEHGISRKLLGTWTGKKADHQTFTVANGHQITLTPAQIMSLYVLNQRDAAKDHLYNKMGGIKSAPTLLYDKKRHRYIEQRAVRPVAVSPLDVQKITDTLSPEQKAVAESVVRFFTTVTSGWGNEVSMRLYGYKKFNAKNYFPIVSDTDYIPMKEGELGAELTTLKNMGSTKHTLPGANNPVIIEDIFDVFTRQADQMGSYNAFVIPLTDMQKVLNFNALGEGSVKGELIRVFGKDVLEYIKRLMIDLNGTAPSERNFVAELTRNMKSAAVGANLRTAIQQPTAYVRAAAEISPKYLARGLKLHVGKDEWERCKKYAPIAQWKDWGYFDINTGRSMKNIMLGPENLKESLIEKSMWMAGKGDEMAWARLWMAVQAETRDQHPDVEEGSEAFYKICGERFSELIDKTQVVDSVLHRSKLMKSKDGLKQMYTSFMSEPTKTYNMLYRAIADTRVKPTGENKKKLAGTLGVYVINAAATALAASVVDALRDDDEDKNFREKYRAAMIGDLWQEEELSWTEKAAVVWSGNLASNLDPVGILPIVKDIESIFMGYSIERTDMSAFQDLYYTIQKWQKKIEGESDKTIPELLVETAKPLSTLTGVPVGNILKDLKAVTSTFIRSFGSPEMNYSRNRLFKDIDSPDNLSNYVAMAMKQYADGNEEMGDRIIQDLRELEIEEIDKKIKSRYTKELKKDPKVIQAAESKRNGKTVEYSRLIKELEETGHERDYVVSAIDGLVRKAETDEEEEDTEENDGETTEKEENTEKALYTAGDAVRAADSSSADFDAVVEELVRIETEEVKAAGKKSSKADIQKAVRSQVKAAFTREYKKSYVSGTNADRQAIRKKLYKVKIGGKQLYSDTDFKNWIKDE